MSSQTIFLGTDCGATTSKIVALREDGTPVSKKLLQRKTRSEDGPNATVAGWVEAIDEYLGEHGLKWDQVAGCGLATPGPYLRYGVFDKTANLPASFFGFDVYSAYRDALKKRTGRDIHVIVGNDGNLGGVAEAQALRTQADEQAVESGGRRTSKATVVMLAPGSGLGCAYVDDRGLPLDGDTLAGMEGGHMPAPIHELGVPPLPCGCGRMWGCIESYTSLAGLGYLLQMKLKDHPGHPLSEKSATDRHRVLELRTLAQQGDPLALELFDFQAKALGYHVAILAMALDPEYFVIGGGLMDPESTTEAFRDRYLKVLRDTAMPNLWLAQKSKIKIVPASLGELSQAIGAALVVRYEVQHAGKP